MVASYSLDLRKRIVKACDNGGKTKAVAERFEVSTSFVRTLKRRRKTTGKFEALPRHSGPKPKLAPHEDRLRAFVKEQPDATLAELRERLGVNVQLSTLWYALDRMKLSVKKNRMRQRAATPRRASRARRMGGTSKDA